MIIDTHLHFWDLATYHGHDDWLKDQPILQRNFLPEDIKPQFDACGVSRGVIIEAARNSHALNLWWLTLAEQHQYIGAVVAGCFLEQDNLAGWLDEYAQSPYFVGIRTSPAGPAAEWPHNAATERGLRELVRRDLSLDMLVGYNDFAAVQHIAAQHPSLRLILDHCGAPPIREGRLDVWREQLAPLAATPNIWIKYSSLLLYAHPDISVEHIRPVADFLVQTFGPDRLLWGSNWPVELMGGSYEQAFASMYNAITPSTTEAEREAIFGANALKFYRVH